MKDFLASVKKKFKRVVFEPPPAWDADEASALAAESGAVAARDPLATGLAPGAVRRTTACRAPQVTRAATRTRPSRSWPRSRRSRRTSDAIYVFTNVDMFADAKRLKKILKLP